jgi:nickel-type superoxide dismutase maturation protease
MGLPIRIFRVADHSMEPSLNQGDYIFVNGVSQNVRVNDVVVIRHPNKNIYIVKRVKKIQGDRFYLLGDNTKSSEDSRKFGALRRDGLVGKLIFKL